MKKPRIRQQRQTTRVTAKPLHYDSDSKNTSPQFYKFLPWLTVILLAVAILVAGGALIMGIQALNRADALQQQAASYEQQFNEDMQPEAASPSPEQTLEGTPPPEPVQPKAAGNGTVAQPKQPVQAAPKATPEEQPAAQQAAPAVQQPVPTQPPVQKQEITVYVTKTGECYHSSDCPHLRQSKIPITLENAKGQGYRRCSQCSAPQ